MIRRWKDMAKRPTWRYAAKGAVFGLLFPFAATAMLLASGAVRPRRSLASWLRNALQLAEKTNVMISHMADHDTLTGLLNRRRMHKELTAAVSLAKRYGEPFALVFIDLNRFKANNDSHGHDAGDRLLSGFATLLEQTTRDPDKVGRWGGDEFVVLLPRATRQGAQQFAERLQQRLCGHNIDIGPVRIGVSASVGIAVHRDDGADPEALLAHADQEMYRVKHDGCATVRAVELA